MLEDFNFLSQNGQLQEILAITFLDRKNAVEKFVQEHGGTPNVPTILEIADVIRNNTVIIIELFVNWKKGLGRLTILQNSFRNFKQHLHLLCKENQVKNLVSVQMYLEKLKIKMTCEFY